MKKALITGIAGQDGSYLSEYLLEIGYEVHGIIRRNSTPEHQETRIEHISEKINTYYGDLLDQSSIENILQIVKPDEIYNLGAQSHVRISFDIPQLTTQINALGVLNLLEACRKICPDVKIYQASSSEMFGNSIDYDNLQRETTIMNPVSPYGCSKLFAYSICKNYKESYGMKIYQGILFNHESPRRGSNFVTSKIIKAVVRIKLGLQNKLELGNLDSYRDWGHSKDYIIAMHLIMQQEKPDIWVVSTMETHSVRELCKYVFEKFNLDYNNFVVQNPKYYRPEELKYLKGDSTKIRTQLGWKPEYTFNKLIDEMIEFWIKYYETI